MLQLSLIMNDVTIAPVKGNDCRNFFWYTSQDETISLLANAGLTEKVEHYKIQRFIITYKQWVK